MADTENGKTPAKQLRKGASVQKPRTGMRRRSGAFANEIDNLCSRIPTRNAWSGLGALKPSARVLERRSERSLPRSFSPLGPPTDREGERGETHRPESPGD